MHIPSIPHPHSEMYIGKLYFGVPYIQNKFASNGETPLKVSQVYLILKDTTQYTH